jgi:AAHS family 4-hydroxybenzoate transporter-like MFS transporter
MWTTAFMILVQTYFVFSWLPTLFSDAGIGASQAVLAATAFPIGSLLSSLALAPLLSRGWSPFLLSAVCALYAVAMAMMGYATGSFWALATVVFLAGVGSGTQGVTHALNVAVYPTRMRSTGVGWCTGVGRVGSILGPYVGGLLVALHWSVPAILQAAAVPGLIAATAMFLLGTLPRTRKILRDAFKFASEKPGESTQSVAEFVSAQLVTTPNR